MDLSVAGTTNHRNDGLKTAVLACFWGNKVFGLPKTLIILGNIFVLNHHNKEVNNSVTIFNLFVVMIQYEDITLDD